MDDVDDNVDTTPVCPHLVLRAWRKVFTGRPLATVKPHHDVKVEEEGQHRKVV